MPVKNETINPQEVKIQSEKIILNAGGEILDWLPVIELSSSRSTDEVINRALILNAMYQLHLNAPKHYIVEWIEKNSLCLDLSPKESAILNTTGELTKNDHLELYWSLEALWALLWATNLISDLPFTQQVGDILAILSPDVQNNEDGYKYKSTMHLKPINSLHRMLDLYYRLHWWLNKAQIDRKDTSNIILEVIKERRKALEWILSTDTTWDDIDLSI